MAAAVLLAGATAGALGMVTPSVKDAEQRVQLIARSHGSTDDVGAVPRRFSAALIATEDSRFYHHHGVDGIAIARATLGVIRRQQGDQGGSTLDQQLAKMLYSGETAFGSKTLAQLTLGVKLDARYSKARILEMYAAVAYFGHGYYGLHDAACGYFGVSPQNLTWSQAALLAGLPQAPSAYDPISYPTRARSRQHHVIDRLVAEGTLTLEEGKTVAAAPWTLGTPAHPDPLCRTQAGATSSVQQ